MQKKELSRTVLARQEDSASNWGNEGVEVLSTPAVLGHMEYTCVQLLEGWISDTEMTVGLSVDMEHLAPSKIGEPVRVTVELVEFGKRPALNFQVMDDSGNLISKGRHERAVVDREKFERKLKDS
ncbi:thioesterase family protein [Nocardiopsis kunsanensis]|uniref:thioesterase family protein n=1 Tax=Nocardiopsis kunsanensis TaxID=141693 RepID=UPI0018748B1B|nr:thioesterase [Nocardiopsis kunsanensis]